MIKIYDFSKAQLSSRNLQYAGRAGEKRGILIDNEYWFLKFPKNTIGMNKVNGISYVTSPLSEFIGSHIFQILGFDVHETRLGIYNDGKRTKVVCACKDFINNDNNEILIPYTALRNDTDIVLMDRFNDSFKTASNLNEILFQLEHNTVLKNIKNISAHFWDIVIVDYLINNNDRNEDNWGVIKYKKENKYELAPVYDCGNSFYGKTSDERIHEILFNNEKLISSSINVVTAYEDDKGERYSAMRLINLKNDDLLEAKIRITTLINKHMVEIEKLVNDIPEEFNGLQIISKERKQYYLETIKLRIKALKNC